LEHDLADVTSLEVLKKLLELTHRSNIIDNFYCESNHMRSISECLRAGSSGAGNPRNPLI